MGSAVSLDFGSAQIGNDGDFHRWRFVLCHTYPFDSYGANFAMAPAQLKFDFGGRVRCIHGTESMDKAPVCKHVGNLRRIYLDPIRMESSSDANLDHVHDITLVGLFGSRLRCKKQRLQSNPSRVVFDAKQRRHVRSDFPVTSTPHAGVVLVGFNSNQRCFVLHGGAGKSLPQNPAT